jgi:transcriptional regulator with XRE-family HTH domain
MTTPTFPKRLPALMTAEDVLKALGRYTRESNESDRRTAAMLGIRRETLRAWLQDGDPPQKRILARLAGFLRRVGYL